MFAPRRLVTDNANQANLSEAQRTRLSARATEPRHCALCDRLSISENAAMHCDDCMSMDLASPALRQALHPRRGSSGILRWRHGGDEVAAIEYIWSGPSARLHLNWRQGRHQHAQLLELQRSRPNFGGERLWFACPTLGHRVRALFLPPNKTRWESRQAHHLKYASQSMSPEVRRLQSFLSAPDARARRNANRRIARRRRCTIAESAYPAWASLV